ncbi:hypothetical protein BE04_45560 [Sorangium cellulosum]|uniref:Transposase IS4-like domain-containing protein n=2 Tax=Sorangium cellulosum TaxID=56 RepID=A0A150Q9Y8_SORCE|nr:hypothetical protein SCE1572_52205 [Sorangium cellulosum So0157-2]KYF64789.1 hypothetical protein BE04_45560 [Sorangium cellulosum]
MAKVVAQWSPKQWHRLAVHQGEKGPIEYDWARARVVDSRRRLPTDEIWLLARRSVSNPSEVAYYLSNAGAATPLATLAHVASTRYTIEQCFEEAKDDVGLDHYEVRTWPSWHRYITLGMMALAWLAFVRAKLPAEGAFPYAPAMNPELVPKAARPGPGKNAERVQKAALDTLGKKSPPRSKKATLRRRWRPGAFPKSVA